MQITIIIRVMGVAVAKCKYIVVTTNKTSQCKHKLYLYCLCIYKVICCHFILKHLLENPLTLNLSILQESEIYFQSGSLKFVLYVVSSWCKRLCNIWARNMDRLESKRRLHGWPYKICHMFRFSKETLFQRGSRIIANTVNLQNMTTA